MEKAGQQALWSLQMVHPRVGGSQGLPHDEQAESPSKKYPADHSSEKQVQDWGRFFT